MKESTNNLLLMQKRENWADYAKFIGIFLVVLGHLLAVYVNPYAYAWIYSFHMPLFFILAGYFVRPKETTRKTLSKGVKSLLRPYFILSVIVSILIILNDYILYTYPKTLALDDILGIAKKSFLGILFVNNIPTSFAHMTIGVMWFVVSLFLVKLVVQIVFEKSKRLNRDLLLLTLVCAILTYVIDLYEIYLYFGVGSAIMGLPFFVFGYYLKAIKILLPTNKYVLFILGILLTLLGLYLSHFNIYNVVSIIYTKYGSNFFLFYVNAIVASLGVIYCCKVFSHITMNVFLYIGQNTLIILPFHVFLIQATYDNLVNKGLDSIIPFFQLEQTVRVGIIVTVFILLLCLIPIYIIRNYFPYIIGQTKSSKYNLKPKNQ